MDHKFVQFIDTQILPFVFKPGRYAGNEINVIQKDWTKVDVTFGLIFPELYELAMSHQGLSILYHILNRETDIAAERIFAPDDDLETLLREKDIPLFSLETKSPLTSFDILGFTVQYELHYTNILNILNLGKIPLFSRERDDTIPLILAGGPCVYNPEPLADFIDAFIIGDGEEVILEVAQLIKQAKQEDWTRYETLRRLAKVQGAYVPAFYEIKYENQSKIASIKPVEADAPKVVTARILPELKADDYPENPLVPLIDTTHNRLGIEIMRGCSQGCRFCNAGMIYRPVRERSVEEIVSHTQTVLENTGYEELSLLSLSTSDYSELKELLSQLIGVLKEKQVKLSFPSLRPETFLSEIALFADDIKKKSGLTLAPEAGTTRLRGVINKTNTNEDLLDAVKFAFEKGWDLIKLYFMVGLPTETKDDLEGIVNLLGKVVDLAKRQGGKKINVSLSPFIPKPHTPFQWEALNSVEQLAEKLKFIRENIKYRHLNLSWRSPELALIEAAMARGDRRIGAVIHHAWKMGSKFDGWSNKFDFEIWNKAFEKAKLEPDSFTGHRDLDELLPWDHLSKGVAKRFLLKERQKAIEMQTTFDCRMDTCHACGLMQQPVCKRIITQQDQKKSPEATLSEKQNSQIPFRRINRISKPLTNGPINTIRVKYAKKPEIRFTSHLDLIRIFERAFRRSQLPIAFSQGFTPRPKISFGLPLAMGFISDAEYLDIQLAGQPPDDFCDRLSRCLPCGLEIIRIKKFELRPRSLMSVTNRIDYHIHLLQTINLQDKIDEFRSSKTKIVLRKKNNQTQFIDIKPYVEEILPVEKETNTVDIVTHLDGGKTARIEEILRDILGFTPYQIATSLVKRTAAYIQRDNRLLTPMEI